MTFRWGSVIFGLYIFYRETFWFDTALPELVRLVSEEQGAALLEVNPRVHYAYCNYQEEDARGGCLLSRAISCCCCVLMTKSKEKGVILMENLKEVGLVRINHMSVWTKPDQTGPKRTGHGNLSDRSKSGRMFSCRAVKILSWI